MASHSCVKLTSSDARNLGVFPCKFCRKVFASFNDLQHHIEHHRRLLSAAQKVHHLCKYCGKLFSRNPYLEQHLATHHRCRLCSLIFPHQAKLSEHLGDHPPVDQFGGATFNLPANIELVESAHKNCFRVYRSVAEELTSSILEYFQPRLCDISSICNRLLACVGAIKIQLRVHVEFSRSLVGEVGCEVYDTFVNSDMRIILNVSESIKIAEEIVRNLNSYVELFQLQGSNWKLNKVIGFDIRTNKFKSLGGNCHVPTPTKIESKKCVVNVMNSDNDCFKWSVLAALFPAKANQNRTCSYKRHESKLIFKEEWMKNGMPLAKIADFESHNSIPVNVFCWNKEEGLLPLRVSERNYASDNKWPTVNLLLLQSIHADQGHYVCIRAISKLMGKHNHHKKDLCFYCLQSFASGEKLRSHMELCRLHKLQKVELPTGVNGLPPVLKFSSITKQLKAGFVCYADFEAIQSAVESTSPSTNTTKLTEHVPCGFAYAIVRDDGVLMHKEVYRGMDCVKVFLSHMQSWGKSVQEVSKNIRDAENSPEDFEKFLMAENCHVCDLPLGQDKAYDHCHRTGKYRGAAHQSCNLNLKCQDRLPVILHSFRSYDSHLIVKGLQHYSGGSISVIPSNSEKYMALVCDELVFIDSLQFLSASLDELTKNLLKCPSDKNENEYRREKLKLMYGVFSEDKVGLLTRKGVFCYDFLDHESKFDQVGLPRKEDFFNKLRDSQISDSDYEHAKNVFKTFGCTTLGDFHDIYLLSDVMLLACIFESFREMSLLHFKLDPCHYYSLPGLAWDAALRMTGVELELLTDIDQVNFIQKGIRGGISLISKRFAQCNNKYMSDHDTSEKSSYIGYLDVNNLYGTVMCSSLPVSGFSWLSPEKVKDFDVRKIGDDDDEGYILEVDLDYPDHLHDLHNDYPLAPERLKVSYDMLSDFQKTLLADTRHIVSERLIAHLGPRQKYVTHYRNLKFYLEKGMILTKIHRVMKFKQKKWLEPFVRFHTEMRMKSKTEFEKQFHKLCVNSVFGKSCENVRKRSQVNITNNYKKALRYGSDPRCKTWHILGENLMLFNMEKRRVKLNKPLYTGMVILDLSKLFMYEFHYDFVKPKYKENAQLLFSDTDSLTYHYIDVDDIYEDWLQDSDLFDTSDYPPDHKLYSIKNKKRLGKVKDEANGRIIREFVGLSSKVYSMEGDDIRKKACKGTSKSIINRHLHHQVFKKTLFDHTKVYHSLCQIRSFKHRLYTIECRKLCLQSLDTKRFILKDGITTLAFNHFRIMRGEFD